MFKGKTISEMRVGDKASISKTITESDVTAFAHICGDTNPLHIDEQYACQTIFKGRVAHGLFMGALISAVIGTRLPGIGTIYLSQNLRFLAPVKLGDTIEAIVEVQDINTARNRANLKTYCRNQRGETVVEGEALIIPPR